MEEVNKISVATLVCASFNINKDIYGTFILKFYILLPLITIIIQFINYSFGINDFYNFKNFELKPNSL